MDPGIRSPLLDLFRRGEAARDVRLLAAKGALAPREIDQLALLVILSDDADAEIAGAANATLDTLPVEPLRAFLARAEVPAEMRDFFAARGGILPASTAGGNGEAPPDEEDEEDAEDDPKVLASLPIVERMKLAMKGTREQRAVLVRDPNRMIAAAVLSSPKLTEAEVANFSRMANVSEDVLRIIGTNRSWTKNYGVILGLTKNPKTPVGMSLNFLARLNDSDIKMLAVDRNVPEPLRIAARKRLSANRLG